MYWPVPLADSIETVDVTGSTAVLPTGIVITAAIRPTLPVFFIASVERVVADDAVMSAGVVVASVIVSQILFSTCWWSDTIPTSNAVALVS